MYICLCNQLKDSHVSAAASEAASVCEIFARLGCKPECGQCVPYIKECLGECRADNAQS
jgi:bacterioferritin-associated ferredoxin